MKTITLLDITASSIGSCASAINLVIDLAKADTEIDHHACVLNTQQYLLLSESMTTVRELIKEMPDKLVSESLNDFRLEFYLHLFSEDGEYDLSKLHYAIHDMHGRIFKILNTARDALELYS